MDYPEYGRSRRVRSSDNVAALVAYVLHLVGTITALPSIIALVINYIKRRDGGAIADSHHAWMIRTFWWAVLWWIIGALTWIFLVGIAIAGVAWLWFIYRHVRGLLYLLDDRPMPA